MKANRWQPRIPIPLSLLVLLVLDQQPSVRASFGDYADLSFQCPALTTCEAVCVSNSTYCPMELTCQNGEILCESGRVCVNNVTDCPEEENPCAINPCGNTFACLRTNLYLDECSQLYDPYYKTSWDCGVEDPRVVQKGGSNVDEERIGWTTATHLFLYTWICVVTVLLLGWCAYNQRISPKGQTVPLHDFTMGGKRRRSSYSSLEGSDEPALWTQTGYKTSIIGTTIYIMVMTTLIGMHILLACLVAFYYAQQRGYGPVNPYKNDVEVLLAFELAWLVSFVWTLILKWPASIEALFLRRCSLSEATHVAVFAPTRHTVKQNKDMASQSEYIARIKAWTQTFFRYLDKFFAFIFSEVHRPNVPGRYHFHKVDKEMSFSFRLRRYNYDDVTETFMPGMMIIGHSLEDMLTHREGLKTEHVIERQKVVGKNAVPMTKPTVLSVTLVEASKIFYVYQIYIIWWWFNFWYWHMGMIYFGMFVLGGATTVYVTYMNEAKLYKLGEVHGKARVKRDGAYIDIPQTELVPGDIISVEPGKCHCDMLLFEAGTILTDESGITGEATPVAKTAVDAAAVSALYSPSTHKKNTISAGSIILETGESNVEALAVVTQTGSFTTKGNLLRDILFYERHQFKFDHEIKLVFFILILYAITGFTMTVIFLKESEIAYAIFYGMYVVETAIPPLIPTVFLVSVGISAERLLRKRIACADNREILVTGKVKAAFFDKTGTLTNQGLDFLSSHLFRDGEQSDLPEDAERMQRGMAVTHTLTKTSKGLYIGTFIDEVMFNASGASMTSASEGPPVVTTHDGKGLKVLKRFEFDHSTMTQSVIIEDETGEVKTYVKGSAESIGRLCTPQSLPREYRTMAENASRDGIYQIALAMGTSPSPKMGDNGEVSYAFVERGEVERDLNFVGFMDFKNTLREKSPDTIAHLKEGNVSCTMVTGDSVFTGIKVAYECGLIGKESRVVLGRSVDAYGTVQWVDGETDEPVALPSMTELSQPEEPAVLAVTGEVWQVLLSRWEEEAFLLAPFIKVYGRCTPNDKVSVVTHFVKRGDITMFTGDGGNDVGALKTAHVGVALSDSEASIVSPFTSLDKNIESVVEVLREGRCCLASAFSSYKFMIMYGQLETVLQLVAAWFSVGFAEWNWVWLDGILALPLAFALPLSSAAERLGPTRPTASLLGPHTMSSACGMLTIHLICLIIALTVMRNQEWYQCRQWESTDISLILALGDNYESNVTFLMICSQYVWSAAAMNFGFTYRKHWIKNYFVVILVVFFSFVHYWITLVPGVMSCALRINCHNDDNITPSVYNQGPVAIQNPYNHTVMPVEFRRFLAVLMTINLLAVLGWEFFIVGHGHGKRAWFFCCNLLFSEQNAAEEYVPIKFSNENDPTKSKDFKPHEP
ncbi:Probable cation-transporting ATPase 13A4 [Seminavis robusta]|uniref:Probable cation-transporting ATPase 13A4 n=1 Tax=Seminavis robusta TaxID=568900 RepID=A0A9N8EQI3_9STRA|nr:Probable cation-transporting ATPase 13A4 [Seminavis robusta]|eukprot:Sro1348_g265010.1 Probable cation-transporting ATPase 13A4 (1393) ;mRNA; f:10462-15080